MPLDAKLLAVVQAIGTDVKTLGDDHDTLASAFNFRKGIMPEDFGAAGDGVTNDTEAFAALTAAVAAQGGGTVSFRPGAIYVVGAQSFVAGQQASGYTFPPDHQYILDFDGCTKPVILLGNGATLKCEDGLKYGTFNDDGTSKGTASGYTGGGVSTPYYAMIRARGCSASVSIRDLELDGNSANLDLGGCYGDNDRQIAHTGIQLGHWDGAQNTCPVEITNVRIHHQGQDGLTISWPGATNADAAYPVTFINCDFDTNARQGVSWVGGKGLTAIGCKFRNTGQGAFASAPKAGIDIEPEGGAVCENGEFINCEFVNNKGSGVNGYGTAQQFIHFSGCKFIGTEASSVYGFGPHWSFDDCQITGQMVNGWASAVTPEATKFNRCKFLFGLDRSPTGAVHAPGGHMFDFGGSGSGGMEWTSCLFDTEGNTAVQVSFLQGGTVRNCEIIQDGATAGVMQYMVWEGTNKITAAAGVDLYGRNNRGTMIYNGTEIARFWGTSPNYTIGSVNIGYDGGGTFVGTVTSLFSDSGAGLRLVPGVGDAYIDSRNDSYSWERLHLRGSNIYLNDGATDRLVVTNGVGVSITGTLGVSGAVQIAGLTDDVATEVNGKINSALIGVADGVASLDSDGLVPAAQLPSYVKNEFTGDSGSGGVKGLVPAPGAGTAAAHKYLTAAGTWGDALAAYALGAGTGVSITTVSANNVVTATLKLSANSIMGNNTGALAAASALTGTQVTAMLDNFTSVWPGTVPASGGGAVNFLRADGAWTTPAVVVSGGAAGFMTGADKAKLDTLVRCLRFFCGGKPGTSEVIGGDITPYAVTLVQANCSVKALTAATASTTITIKKNGTSIGTAVFAAGGTTATVTITTAAVAKGDSVTFHAPASADATLSDIFGLLSE